MRRYYVVAVVAICLALSFLPTSLNAAQSVGSTIVNTETNPVPVKNVNTETNPVPTYDVENSDRTPYSYFGLITIESPAWGNSVIVNVPAGIRVVWEFVGINCSSTNSSDAFPPATLGLSKGVAGTIHYPILMTRQGYLPDGRHYTAASQQVRLYHEGGYPFAVGVNHGVPDASVVCAVSLSGYTVAQ